jgi:hypothetical protein
MRFTVTDYLRLALNDKLYFDGHYFTYNHININLNKEEATAELVSYYPEYIPRRAASIDDLGNVTFEGGSDDLILLEDELVGSTPGGRVVDIGNQTTVDIISTSPSNPSNSTATGGDLHYTHDQSTASNTWTVTHNLGKEPAVQTFDSGQTEIKGKVVHTNLNSCVIHFEHEIIGKAHCN